MNILFVCTGNTCRSPMAQALGEKLFPSHTFSSAGLFAYEGQRLSPAAKKVLTKHYDREDFDHSAKSVTVQDLESADLVIAMTRGHKARLEEAFGRYPSIHAMPEDIPDPYGEDENTYLQCAKAIEKGIQALAKEGVIHD